MSLRPYQQRAYEAVIDSLRKGNHPVCAMATGSGKSWVAAALVNKMRSGGGYTLLLSHVAELITQDLEALEKYAGLHGVGVFSSGLNKKIIGESVTFGTVQTVFRNLDKFPEVDVICVDEAHLIAPRSSDTKMYKAVFNRFPNARRIGLSATPYRLTEGLIYAGEDAFFNDLAIDIKVRDLVGAGWLSPLKGISASVQLDLTGVHKTNGDFDTKEVDERMTVEWLEKVIESVIRLAPDRKAILMFTPTVRVAELAAEISCKKGLSAEYVHGGDKERGDRLARWEAGEFKLMANCQILTVGYDRPDIDCIVDCSPTESLGKHIQKLGRGTRKAEGKTDCLVIDVAGNLTRLGGISSEADFEEEKPNGDRVAGVIRKPVEKKSRATKRANLIDALDPMSGGAKELLVNVDNVSYVQIGSKSQPGKSIVLVNYECSTESGHSLDVSDFVMPEYEGWARSKSEAWARRRGINLPYTCHDTLCVCYGAAVPRSLKIKRNGKYFNVVDERF